MTTFRNALAAELLKLRSLPMVSITIGTVFLVTVGLSFLLARAENHTGATASETMLPVIQYTQIGFILLGIVTVASEYGGGQIHTSLVSVPNRLLLLGAKAVAYLTAALATALLTVAAAVAVVQLTLEQPASMRDQAGPLVGAVAYLVLIGLFAEAVAAIARNLVAALVAVCVLVLIISPYLRTITTVAAYLPDSAGRRLYLTEASTDGSLTALQGAATLTVWLLLAHLIAGAAFVRRDAGDQL